MINRLILAGYTSVPPQRQYTIKKDNFWTSGPMIGLYSAILVTIISSILAPIILRKLRGSETNIKDKKKKKK